MRGEPDVCICYIDSTASTLALACTRDSGYPTYEIICSECAEEAVIIQPLVSDDSGGGGGGGDRNDSFHFTIFHLNKIYFTVKYLMLSTNRGHGAHDGRG